jgi:hypothetical protein
MASEEDPATARGHTGRRAERPSRADTRSDAARKRAERGGFDERIFLEYVEQSGEAVHTPENDEAVRRPSASR